MGVSLNGWWDLYLTQGKSAEVDLWRKELEAWKQYCAERVNTERDVAIGLELLKNEGCAGRTCPTQMRRN